MQLCFRVDALNHYQDEVAVSCLACFQLYAEHRYADAEKAPSCDSVCNGNRQSEFATLEGKPILVRAASPTRGGHGQTCRALGRCLDSEILPVSGERGCDSQACVRGCGCYCKRDYSNRRRVQSDGFMMSWPGSLER